MKTNNNLMKKEEMQRYEDQVRKRAQKFKLKSKDAHNLYDLYWMTNSPSKTKVDLIDTLKINKMDKWFYNFTKRIEKIVLGYNLAFGKKKE